MSRAYGVAMVIIATMLILFTLLFTSALHERCSTPIGVEARLASPAFEGECLRAGLLAAVLGLVDLVLVVAGVLRVLGRAPARTAP